MISSVMDGLHFHCCQGLKEQNTVTHTQYFPQLGKCNGYLCTSMNFHKPELNIYPLFLYFHQYKQAQAEMLVPHLVELLCNAHLQIQNVSDLGATATFKRSTEKLETLFKNSSDFDYDIYLAVKSKLKKKSGPSR